MHSICSATHSTKENNGDYRVSFENWTGTLVALIVNGQ